MAAKNTAGRATLDVVQADLFKLPFKPDVFDMAYSVGVLHHTPDASGAFRSVSTHVRPGGSLHIFVHAQGNRALYAMNRFLRSFTAKASYKTTWGFSQVLTGVAKFLSMIPLAGPLAGVTLRQLIYFSPDQHNNLL